MNRLSFLRASAAIAVSTWPAMAMAAATTFPKHHVSGVIVSVSGNLLILRKRDGTTVSADLSEAVANQHVGVLAPNRPIVLHGTYLANGTFHCAFTSSAGPSSRDWAGDN